MAAASSLVSAFEGWSLCYWQWASVVAVLFIFPLQLRTLHSLSGLSALSDAFVVVVLCLILGVFISDGRGPDVVTSTWIPPDVTFIEGYGSLSSVIFAFQGLLVSS